MKGEEKEEVKGEVNEETNHVVEKMDTSAAAPADLAGTVMEVTKGKEFKVIISFFLKPGPYNCNNKADWACPKCYNLITVLDTPTNTGYTKIKHPYAPTNINMY